MPLYFNKKIVYIHIPKTRWGSSIEQFLKVNDGVDKINCDNLFGVDQNLINDHSLQHCSYSEIVNIVNKLNTINLDECTIFTVVRNPYDRLVSEYFYLLTAHQMDYFFVNDKKQDFNLFVNTILFDMDCETRTTEINKFHRLNQYNQINQINKINKINKINDMIKRKKYEVHSLSKNNYDQHFEKQISFISGAEHSIHIMKYETLDEDFKQLFNKPLNFKSNVSKNKLAYSEMYSAELQLKVYNYYIEDFQKFGYSYEIK